MNLHDEITERALLGCIIFDPLIGLDVALQHGVTAESFFVPVHRSVFSAVHSIWNDNGTVDRISLQNKINQDGIGHPDLIESLYDACPTVAHVAFYADKVVAFEKRRKLQRLGKQIMAGAEAEDIEEAVSRAESQLISLLQPISKSETLVDVAEAIINDWQSIASGTKKPGIPSRYDALNEYIGGYSQYTILAARPSQGKSTFALNEAATMAVNGLCVGIASVEMTAGQCLGRMACDLSDVNQFSIQNGFEAPERLERATHQVRNLAELQLHITDTASTIDDICSWSRMTHMRYQLDILFVDYLQLIRATQRYGNANDRIQDFSARLLLLRKQLGIPVVVLSQLNRSCEAEDRLPRLSDLRDSGAIEQDGHTIFLLSHAPKCPDRDKCILQIAKNRDGPCGKVELVRNFRRQRFESKKE